MRFKRVGNYTLDVFMDSMVADIGYCYNDSVKSNIMVRSEEDLHDLEHVVACIRKNFDERKER